MPSPKLEPLVLSAREWQILQGVGAAAHDGAGAGFAVAASSHARRVTAGEP